jgi:hypothetical protein
MIGNSPKGIPLQKFLCSECTFAKIVLSEVYCRPFDLLKFPTFFYSI